MKRHRIALTGTVLLLCAVVAGCAQKQTETTQAPDTTAAETTKAEATGMPEPNELGIVTADQWTELFPEIVESYQKNSENSEVENYLELNPEIVTLYEGIGFSKDYNSARGHSYTLEDVSATARPHPLSNCLACKTPDYVALMNKYGADFYSMSFEDALAEMDNAISCYDCHLNTPASGPVASRPAFLNATEGAEVDPDVLSCGQCHNEYYFDPDTKEVKHPYTNLEEVAPEKILAYYNEMGFTDYQNPRTLTNHIKVQHPEYETVMGAGAQKMNLTCADCHMEQVEKEDGTTYTSHYWVSPVESPAILESRCVVCHGSTEQVIDKVTEIQEEITARETEVAKVLVELTEKLAEAVANGDYTEEELEAIRSLNRDAQFYWDFVYVENSEGAHNSKLSKECLDKAEELANEALALFK